MNLIQTSAVAVLMFLASGVRADTDPRITSWFTANSGKYARIYQSSTAQTSGTTSTTWSRGSGTQSLPTYADVSEVSYSSSWVYIRSTGLASHIMGPWYIDAAKTTNFPNFPSNNAVIYRIPRNPTVPGTKTLTGLGAIGRFVNGVSFFDNRDAYSYAYNNGNGMDATPTNGLTGDGIWNRDAYVNEAVTFDAGLAHQAGNNYHYHVHPIALRYQLGDHVDYNSTTNVYTESTSSPAKHSPIIAWASDGYPVYGPYGYSNPTDATSGVRRMVSGFVLRNGSNGTNNVNTDGRKTLPAWAASWQGRSQTLTDSTQWGPSVSTTYTLGHYLEDNDFLGDLGYVQTTGATVRDYDLDKYNGRTCVTPEFPGGTYAYFATINADGTPAFPYNIGRQFYGSPTGGSVTSITETVTTQVSAGPNKQEAATGVAISGNNATFSWSAVEGGTYTVQASNDLSSWTSLTPTVTATADSAAAMETGAAGSNTRRFYKATRNSLASFDTSGFNITGAPTVTTSAASGVGSSSATLNGTVTANNASTSVSFEYGLTTSYGNSTGGTPPTVTGSSAASVTATLSGLSVSTTYHYRTKGVNSYGTTYGADQSFTTTASGGGGSVSAPGAVVTRGQAYTLTINIPTNTTPSLPPANVGVSGMTIAGSSAGISSMVHTSQYVVTCTYAVPAGASTGLQNITITFPGPPTYTFSGYITIN